MINYNEPIYDPFNKRGPTYYHPANDAAINLIAIQLICVINAYQEDLC